MDAVSSFTSLIDNLPLWKAQLTELSTYTSQKQEEFKAEYTRIVSNVKPRRVRSPSVCSIHTNDDVEPKDIASQRRPTPQPPDLVDISPFEAGNRYIYAQATRKRKPGTSFRSGASGPLKFRSKQMVVIYYDSHVQDKLDSLVKAIGGSRNNLRKGKNSYTISKGLQLPTLARKYDLPGLEGIRSSAAYRSAPKLINAKSDPLVVNDSVPAGEATFKQTDKDLEICQNLCETAAHQFLRDGDCKIELDTVLQNLDRIQELAKSALESFKAEEKKDEVVTDVTSGNSSLHTQSDATLVEQSSREVLNFNHKLGPSSEAIYNQKRPSLPSTVSAPPLMTEIEVDDETDQSSIEIDLSKYRKPDRAANRAGLRS